MLSAILWKCSSEFDGVLHCFIVFLMIDEYKYFIKDLTATHLLASTFKLKKLMKNW